MSNGARNQLSIDLQAEEGPVIIGRNGIHKQRRRLVAGLKAVHVVAGVMGASGPAIGTAKGETSQQAGQQSLGVRGGESTPQHNPSWGRRIRRQRRMWHKGLVLWLVSATSPSETRCGSQDPIWEQSPQSNS